MKTYPLGDTPTAEETNNAPFNERFYSHSLGVGASKWRAVYTGEKRKPKKGEWFLSGNPVDAYKACADMDQVYHIARLVKVTLKPAEWVVA
jgi:hypothetical protein